jgi:hypothetical protein
VRFDRPFPASLSETSGSGGGQRAGRVAPRSPSPVTTRPRHPPCPRLTGAVSSLPAPQGVAVTGLSGAAAKSSARATATARGRDAPRYSRRRRRRGRRRCQQRTRAAGTLPPENPSRRFESRDFAQGDHLHRRGSDDMTGRWRRPLLIRYTVRANQPIAMARGLAKDTVLQ